MVKVQLTCLHPFHGLHKDRRAFKSLHIFINISLLPFEAFLSASTFMGNNVLFSSNNSTAFLAAVYDRGLWIRPYIGIIKSCFHCSKLWNAPIYMKHNKKQSTYERNKKRKVLLVVPSCVWDRKNVFSFSFEPTPQTQQLRKLLDSRNQYISHTHTTLTLIRAGLCPIFSC